MPTSEIVQMLKDTLRIMLIGVSGVFIVLSIFYGSVKLLMKVGDKQTEENDD